MSQTTRNQVPSERSLRDLYYVLFRNTWRMVGFFLLVVLGVSAATFLSPNIYRSEARILVQLGRESVSLDPTATTGQIMNVQRSLESEIKSELEILRSRELCEQVVDVVEPRTLLASPTEGPGSQSPRHAAQALAARIRKALKPRDLLERLGLSEPVSDRDRAISKAMKQLDVQALDNSNILQITFEGRSSQVAQRIVSTLIEHYLEKHIEVHRTPGSYDFFAEQSGHLQEQLRQSESTLQQLKNETGVSSLAEHRMVLLDRIRVLEQQLGLITSDLGGSESRIAQLEETLSTVPATLVRETSVGFPNDAADTMRQRLFDLKMKERMLVENSSSDVLNRVRRGIADAEALLQSEERTRTHVTEGISKAHEELELALLTERANLASLQSKVRIVRTQLAEARAELKPLNDAEVKLARLERQVRIQESNYNKYSDNLEQSRIDQALELGKISNISVVQPATLEPRPVRPRTIFNLAVALVLGAVGAVSLAFLRERWDHSLKTPEDVESRLRLPTLASIPRSRANRLGLTSTALARTNIDRQIAAASTNRSTLPVPVSDQYESFRQTLLARRDSENGRPVFIAVGACHRGEGASTVAANLASTLAQCGDGVVLLVDGDLGYPSLHRVESPHPPPSGPPANGSGPASEKHRSVHQNLQILSTSASNGNLAEIFQSRKFTDLFDDMECRGRFVVIDLPPLSEVGAAARVASLCDGVVLVAEAGRLRWQVGQRVVQQLERAQANLLGVVLNKRRFPIPRWLYRTL